MNVWTQQKLCNSFVYLIYLKDKHNKKGLVHSNIICIEAEEVKTQHSFTVWLGVTYIFMYLS